MHGSTKKQSYDDILNSSKCTTEYLHHEEMSVLLNICNPITQNKDPQSEGTVSSTPFDWFLRDDIKSSGEFEIFTSLKIEGEGVKGTLRKNYHKNPTVEDIYVKITQNDLECNRDRK